MAKPAGAKYYLAAASPRYRATHAALGKAVRRVFPRARPIFRYDLPGWAAPRPKGAPGIARSTLPTTHTLVMLAETKAGLTAHVGHPGDFDLLRHHRAALTKAGLKPGRGCLVWTRKGDFPVAAVEGLLREVRKADAAVAKGA